MRTCFECGEVDYCNHIEGCGHDYDSGVTPCVCGHYGGDHAERMGPCLKNDCECSTLSVRWEEGSKMTELTDKEFSVLLAAMTAMFTVGGSLTSEDDEFICRWADAESVRRGYVNWESAYERIGESDD